MTLADALHAIDSSDLPQETKDFAAHTLMAESLGMTLEAFRAAQSSHPAGGAPK